MATSASRRAFARRMAIMAAAAAIVMAAAPPGIYLVASRTELEAAAATSAAHVAESVRRLALRQPHLWRYNVGKVVRATANERAMGRLRAIRITDCGGAPLIEGEGLGDFDSRDPSAWSPVVTHGVTVAWVQVTIDDSAQLRVAGQIALASVVLALLLGGALFVVPTRVVWRQTRALDDLVTRLQDAEIQLKGKNLELSGEVEAAIERSRALARELISIQEEERARVARDLHDSLGQLLAALEIELELARSAPEHIEEARALTGTIMGELRRAVRDLQPVELETAGLVEVLRGTCERFEMRTSVETSFRHNHSEATPPITDANLSRCLLRVTQEALTNVGRHAEAFEVGVILTVTPDRVRLEIRDDGHGFDVERDSSGMGLRSINERVHYLGGEVTLRSSDEGTYLDVNIPRARAAKS